MRAGSGDVAGRECGGERVARLTGSEAKTLNGTGRRAKFDGELDDLHRFQLTGPSEKGSKKAPASVSGPPLEQVVSCPRRDSLQIRIVDLGPTPMSTTGTGLQVSQVTTRAGLSPRRPAQIDV